MRPAIRAARTADPAVEASSGTPIGQSSTPTRVRADQMLQKQQALLGQRRAELKVDLKERALARARQEQQVARVELTNTIATLSSRTGLE